MDTIHKLLNIVIPLISLVSLFIFLLPILLFKISSSIVRSVFTENVAGKVVLITGASSGIGEHLAYEYAKGGACLVLVARRERQLEVVANEARRLGSPDVIIESGDVSKVQNCKQFVDAALNHFGKLDHLVNNAGIAPVCMFEDITNVDDFTQIMNTNYWGSVYCTHFAIPYLKKSRGKIIEIASVAGWFAIPGLSIYCASKGAQVSFYEVLRIEVGSDIGITIVTPGFVDSEITRGEFMSKAGPKYSGLTNIESGRKQVSLSVNIGMSSAPVEATETCAKAILKSICRGDRYLTEPAWMRMIYLWNLLCPELLERIKRWVSITRHKNPTSNISSGVFKAD